MGQQEATQDRNLCFHHETLLYAGEEGFVDGTLPFIEEALSAREPLLVAVPGAKLKLLTHVLGRHARRVHLADMRVLGRNPARIIPAWRRFLAEHAPEGRPVRGIGEPIWAGRGTAELSECQRHESLLNAVFDGGQAWRLLCPYDLESLDEEVIDAARRSHPFVAQDGSRARSDVYLAGGPSPHPFDGALPPPASPPAEFVFTNREELGEVRWFVTRSAGETSLDPNRTEDLVLAVNELAANSLCHGGGTGTLRIWTESEVLMCEVEDRGQISDPLVGRTLPAPDQPSGRGLWVVNHLCDLVQIRSSHAGSVVRVHMRLHRPAGAIEQAR